MKAVPPSEAASGNYDKEAYKAEFIARRERLSTSKEKANLTDQEEEQKDEQLKSVWEALDYHDYTRAIEKYKSYKKALNKNAKPITLTEFKKHWDELTAKQTLESIREALRQIDYSTRNKPRPKPEYKTTEPEFKPKI